jgi:hypothetical protein
MRRAGVIVLLAVACAGLAALALLAATDKRDLAFTIGVAPTIPAASLAPGATVCQSPISVAESFTRVRVRAGALRGRGQPLDLTVRSAESRRVLAGGRIAAGYADRTDQATRTGPVAAGQRIAVCVRNAGLRKAILYGNTAGAAPPSGARRPNRRALTTDVAVVFLKDDRRSMLAALPDVFERASVFRPGWVGPWTFWVLAVLALAGVPLLLAKALSGCGDRTGGAFPERRP